jgi:hypothetical protein
MERNFRMISYVRPWIKTINLLAHLDRSAVGPMVTTRRQVRAPSPSIFCLESLVPSLAREWPTHCKLIFSVSGPS